MDKLRIRDICKAYVSKTMGGIQSLSLPKVKVEELLFNFYNSCIETSDNVEDKLNNYYAVYYSYRSIISISKIAWVECSFSEVPTMESLNLPKGSVINSILPITSSQYKSNKDTD